MTHRYAALLRGINVGGNAKVAMADLRATLTGIGLTDVATLLQSGNAVFTAPAGKPEALTAKIETALAERFGRAHRVVLRSAADIRKIVEGDPFAGIATDGSRYAVTFCAAAPPKALVDSVSAADVAPERFAVIGREIYMWCPDGLRDTKLAKAFSDRKLGTLATTRNWNTVTKLHALLEA
jgi:uncharacterized protein (DUF1697 family)